MATDTDTRCTIVICHSEKIKTTLFEILERMKCETCEISSLNDLLDFLQDSNFSFLHFSEVTNEDSILFMEGNPAIYSKEDPLPESQTSGKIHLKDNTGHSKDSVYKSNHMTLGEIEKIYIIKTLKSCGWKCKTAAKLLGINRTTLYRKMKKYGIIREK